MFGSLENIEEGKKIAKENGFIVFGCSFLNEIIYNLIKERHKIKGKVCLRLLIFT